MDNNTDITEIISGIPAFAALDDESVQAIASASSLRSVAGESVFYSEDETSYDVFYIVSGIVGIRSRLPNGGNEESELLTLHSGVAFGVLSFLDGARRDFNAVARERCLVLRMDGPLLKAVCAANPVAGSAVYAFFGQAAARNARDVALELRNYLAAES